MQVSEKAPFDRVKTPSIKGDLTEVPPLYGAHLYYMAKATEGGMASILMKGSLHASVGRLKHDH